MDDDTKTTSEDITDLKKVDKRKKKLIDEFAPRIDPVDRRIFYEIIGSKLNDRAEFV